MAAFPQAPRLDALIARLGRALRAGVWLYGIGTIAAAACAWLLFMYAADRVLDLPAPIRIFHLAVLVGGAAYLFTRLVLRHARAMPGREGLAMMAQAALPGDVPRDDRFVSALQLPRSVPADSPAAPLVRRVIESAEAVAERADLSRVLDVGGPRKRMAAAAVAALALGGALGAEPAMARIFGARMLGANVGWPRATTLVVEVPDGDAGITVDDSDPEVIRVRAARGADVPVYVTAEGVVPDVVTLTYAESGAAIDVGPSGPAAFRTVLAAVQTDSVVRVTGGDDRRGVPRIEVEVLQPPDIEGLAFAVTPPAYAGLEPSVATDVTTVRALAGSRVAVHVQPDPEGATGIARTFPDDEVIELTRSEWPAAMAPGADGAVPPAPATLAFDQVVSDSLRFRFELLDDSGLTNPDPALYGIEVYPDRAPEVLVLSPTQVDRAVVAGGAVPLRALVRDDFGGLEARLQVFDGITEDLVAERPLALEDVTGATLDATGDPEALASELLEVNGLSGDRPAGTAPADGTVLAIRVAARDGREPEPGETLGSPITLRFVSQDEFLRRQRDGLRIAAETLRRLRDRVETAEIDLAALSAATSGDEAEAPTSNEFGGLLNDARRLEGDLSTLTRDLADLAGAHVFSRIDDRAGAVEARLVELLASPDVRGFSREAWAQLGAELDAGRLGAPTTAGDLVRLVALGIQASGPRSEAWIESLAAARAAASQDGDLSDVRASLADASEGLLALRGTLDQLAGTLGEWDSMQSIQARARDLLNSSKNLQQRLEQQAERK